jgi:hypothetical protein
MATTLDSLVGGADAPKERSVVTSYSGEIRKHEKDGKVSYALVVSPVYSNGARGRNALWVWLDGPESLRAFRDSLPSLAKGADALDAKMVEAKEWKPRPAPAAKAAAPAAPAPAPASAPKSALDGALGDLPF